MWNPGTTSVNAYAPQPLPAPVQINPNGFTQNFQSGMQDQVGRNALQSRYAAGAALALGDYAGAKAAAFGGGDTQLGMQLNEYQQAQQLKAFQMLGNVAMLSGGDPDKWQRAVASVRSAGYNVSPAFDDPTNGPQAAIAMAGLAPQMFAQGQAKQQMGLEQAKFGLEKNTFDFNRSMALYGQAYNQWIMGGQQGPMPTQAQFGVGGGGSAQLSLPPPTGMPAGAPALQGNALTPVQLAPPAGASNALTMQPSMPLNYTGPNAGTVGGNALAMPDRQAQQPAALPPLAGPATAPGYQTRAVGLPIPTAEAATGAPMLGPQSMSMVRLGASSTGLSRLLSTLPENRERGAYAETMGKNTADIVAKQQQGQSLLDQLATIHDRILTTPDKVVQDAFGPGNQAEWGNFSVPGALGYAGMTGPEARQAMFGKYASKATNDAYNFQNEIGHNIHLLSTAFIQATGGSSGAGTDAGKKIFGDAIGAMQDATDKAHALKIVNDAYRGIRKAFQMPDTAVGRLDGGRLPGVTTDGNAVPDAAPAANANGPPVPASGGTDPLGLFN